MLPLLVCITRVLSKLHVLKNACTGTTVQTTGIPDQIERSAGDLVLDRGPPKKITHAHIYVHKHMIIITSTVIIVTVII